MKKIRTLYTIAIIILTCTFTNVSRAQDVNPTCNNANIFTNVFTQVCWDCFLDGFNLFGVAQSNVPDGARTSIVPFCFCTDNLGVPEAGFPTSYWAPAKLNEVVSTPWCSPSLGGIKLQDTLSGLGSFDYGEGEDGAKKGFYQYHYFSYPLMAMLDMLVLPGCTDGYIDFDLMYISEIDPLWNNDLLALVLNPEAIIFANPAAKAWCSIDCALTTADNQKEAFYGCAGCDGSLYPLTGNVYPNIDPVASSSLITQRTLAGLHRKGLARKTIGDDAMCEPEFYPTIPRSQYKFSMIYPVPEAESGGSAISKSDLTGIDGVENADNEGYASDDDLQKAADKDNLAGKGGVDTDRFGSCCHPMGMSTYRWCTAAGGRMPPGKSNAFVYMIWNYRDCCVRGQ